MTSSNKHIDETYKALWKMHIQLSTMAWLMCIGLASYFCYENLHGNNRYWIPVLMGVYLCLCYLFRIKGYRIRGHRIEVLRPFHKTIIDASALRKIRLDPHGMQASSPILANLGLFSFNGWFYNDRHGRYRAFVTDPTSIVRIQIGKDTPILMFSPEHPEHFLRTLREATKKD